MPPKTPTLGSSLDITGFDSTRAALQTTKTTTSPDVATSIGTQIGIAQQPTNIPVPKISQDMDAGELSSAITGSNVVLPSGKTLNVSNNTIVGAATAIEAQTLQQRQAEVDRETQRIEAERKVAEGVEDQAELTEGKTRVELQKTLLEENLEKLDVDISEFKALSGGVAKLQGDLLRLDVEELAVLEQARQRGETTSFASGQVAKERRQFAILRAGISAELGAKVAFLHVLQGNFKLAKSLTDDTVENFFLDKQDELDTIKDFRELNLDIIKQIDKEAEAALVRQEKRLEKELKDGKDDLRFKLNAALDDPEAARKAGFTSPAAMAAASLEEFTAKMIANATVKKTSGDLKDEQKVEENNYASELLELNPTATDSELREELLARPNSLSVSLINSILKNRISQGDIRFEVEDLVFEVFWGTGFSATKASRLKKAKLAAIDDINKGGLINIEGLSGSLFEVNLDDEVTRQRFIDEINNLTVEGK